MYGSMLLVHSWLRWVVLLLGALAAVRGVSGSLGGKPWRDSDDRAGLLFSIAMDVQFLVGLVLYVALSPTTQMAFEDMRAAMGNSALRFWAVEHVTMMVIALVVAHISRVMIRRATTSAAKHRRAAVGFSVALLLMIAATPWPMMANGRPWLRLG